MGVIKKPSRPQQKCSYSVSISRITRAQSKAARRNMFHDFHSYIHCIARRRKVLSFETVLRPQISSDTGAERKSQMQLLG